MVRKFLTFDGEVLEETEWTLRTADPCFYCGEKLATVEGIPCFASLDGLHDWITLVNPSNRR